MVISETGMFLVQTWVPMRHIECLDDLVEKGKYRDRAEAIRLAIRDLLIHDYEDFNLELFREPKIEKPRVYMRKPTT